MEPFLNTGVLASPARYEREANLLDEHNFASRIPSPSQGNEGNERKDFISGRTVIAELDPYCGPEGIEYFNRNAEWERRNSASL